MNYSKQQKAFLVMIDAEYKFLLECGWKRDSENTDLWIMPMPNNFPTPECWKPDLMPQNIAIQTAATLMDKTGLYDMTKYHMEY